MKQNLLNLCLALVAVVISDVSFSQRRGDKSAKFLNYTFDKLEKPDEEVSDAGQIGLFKGLKPSSSPSADAFFGGGDYGAGANVYGFARPKAFSEEKFEGSDAFLFRYGNENLGYGGIITMQLGNKNAAKRSYITIPFMDETGRKSVKMIEGKVYCIEMSISLAEASKFSTNNIGFMFVKNVSEYQTDKENSEEASVPFYDDNNSGRVVYNIKNRIYNSYGDWDKVANIYKAKGDETGVVIGNFMMNEKTKYETNKKIDPKKMEMNGEDLAEVPATLPLAYYYIDNIRIKEIETRDSCYCMKRDTTNLIQLSGTVITKDFMVSDKLSKAKNIESQFIYYGQGERKPEDVGKDIIDYLGAYLRDKESASVVIVSHQDNQEDSLALEYSYDEDMVEQFSELSRKRAEYIQDRLMENFGISSSRISIDAKENLEPNTNEMPKGGEGLDDDMKCAYNRRVTFLIRE
jgi:outer membrane protein OmpA-like peptidoglycan-associated protein